MQRTYTSTPTGRDETTGSGPQANIRFAAGQHIDGLTRFGVRFYDPATGQWTQPDPLDQTTDLRQANRYGYVGGDAVNWADPLGLYGCYQCNIGDALSDGEDRLINATKDTFTVACGFYGAGRAAGGTGRAKAAGRAFRLLLTTTAPNPFTAADAACAAFGLYEAISVLRQ